MPYFQFSTIIYNNTLFNTLLIDYGIFLFGKCKFVISANNIARVRISYLILIKIQSFAKNVMLKKVLFCIN